MKTRKSSGVLLIMLVIGVTTFLGGCAMTGMDRSVKTSNSIQEVDDEIGKMAVQLDKTSASLDTLMMSRSADLEKSFETYTDNIAKVEKEGNRVLERMEEMKEQSKEYFAEWETQGNAYTNPRIRELSEERRLKLAETYAKVPAAAAGIKVTYLAYLANLKEIQIYLSNDLTPQGIESIAPVVNNTANDLEALKTSMHPVMAALSEIKAELQGGTK